jgi:hypothetical protein
LDPISNPQSAHKIARGEFAETALRHRCRNPKCRMRLPTPVSNDREAFCCRGCHSSFYLRRCRVCERPIERAKTGGNPHLICKRAQCRNAFASGLGFGRFHAKPGEGKSRCAMPQEVPVNQAPFCASEAVDRAAGWRQIAGPPLPPLAARRRQGSGRAGLRMHRGEYERVTARDRAALKAAEQAEIAANAEFTDPAWREVVSPDGVRCFVTRFRAAPIKKSIAVEPATNWLAADLSIPTALRRAS